MTKRKNIIQGEKMKPKQWNVISLGAGVQSSTMALMASRGELLGIEVDFAIFADTQDESKKVYDWLDWLERQLSFPVYRVTKGKLSDRALEMRTTEDGRIFPKVSVPLHVLTASGERTMITHRNCTSDYKIKPILRELRSRCGINRGQKVPTVTSLIGISRDEMQRMKDSREPWAVNRWPLVELRMNRGNCMEWMSKNGYPEPPKSACVYCPFKSGDLFRQMQIDDPEGFQKAVDFEKQTNSLRSSGIEASRKNRYFVYRSCKPLDEIDFRSDVERGQGLLDFQDECEGMCGV
jgi:hypothetical protein